MKDNSKNIIQKNIEDIIPYENNPRKNDKAVDFVANSIREFGFKIPIIIDSHNVVVCGHTRLKAAKKLGLKEVPCICADDLTDQQIKAFRIADNKVGELASWDEDLLTRELEDITDFDMSEFGDFGDIICEEENEIVEDEVPDEVQPICKRGDIWQLGNHRLMCGDSTQDLNIVKLISGQDVDLIFTDPPYGMNAVSKSGVLSKRYKTDILNDDNNIVAIKSFKVAQNLFINVKQVWWGANYYTECLPSAECWIVWDKNNGNSDQTDCELAWTNFRSVVRKFIFSSEKKERIHPTQKPIKLIREILRKFEKDLRFNCILDLFGGSGSTLIACEQLNRKCYMMELDEHYCDVIIERFKRFNPTAEIKRINNE